MIQGYENISVTVMVTAHDKPTTPKPVINQPTDLQFFDTTTLAKPIAPTPNGNPDHTIYTKYGVSDHAVPPGLQTGYFPIISS